MDILGGRYFAYHRCPPSNLGSVSPLLLQWQALLVASRITISHSQLLSCYQSLPFTLEGENARFLLSQTLF